MKYKVPFYPALFFAVVAVIGLWNLTREEGVSFRSYVQHYEFSEKNITILSQDVAVSAEFTAIEPQLGIVSFRFQKPDRETTAAVVFRIKEKGNQTWYYEHTYTANQLYIYDWYPFGFPILEQSRGRTYQFELAGVSERKEDAVLLLADRGFLVQYQLPNDRLFTPVHRILLELQKNLSTTVKGEIIVYSGFIIVLFLFSFFSKRLPVFAKNVFTLGTFLFVFLWQLHPYRFVQISTICVLILTVYSGVFMRLLNGTKALILSGLVFALMGIYYVFGKIAFAERLAEWTYILMIIALMIILAEINTKISNKRQDTIQ